MINKMRLEKIMYEKVLNSKMLGRAREMGTPSRVKMDVGPDLTYTPLSEFSILWKPIQRWIYKKEWNFLHSQLEQRGLCMEDVFMHTDEDMRRDPFVENMMRESLHPMYYNLHKYRRVRFNKVDHAVTGFEAPEYLKAEARKRTYIESLTNLTKMMHFIFQDYQSDLTPNSYFFTGNVAIFEFMTMHNMMNPNAWTRYFFNEKHYHSMQNYIKETDKEPARDLDTPEGWENFKVVARQWNTDFPGMFAPKGEEVDFVRVREIFDEFKREMKIDKLDFHVINDLRRKARLDGVPFEQPEPELNKKEITNNVGADLPKHIRPKETRAFFS